MRQRRSSNNNKKFRPVKKPRRLQGLPNDEPELPLTPEGYSPAAPSSSEPASTSMSPSRPAEIRPPQEDISAKGPVEGAGGDPLQEPRAPRPRRTAAPRAPRPDRPERTYRGPRQRRPVEPSSAQPPSDGQPGEFVPLPRGVDTAGTPIAVEPGPTPFHSSTLSESPAPFEARPSDLGTSRSESRIPFSTPSDGFRTEPSPSSGSSESSLPPGPPPSFDGSSVPTDAATPVAPAPSTSAGAPNFPGSQGPGTHPDAHGRPPSRNDNQNRRDRFEPNRRGPHHQDRDRNGRPPRNDQQRHKQKNNKNFGPRGRYNRDQNRFEPDGASNAHAGYSHGENSSENQHHGPYPSSEHENGHIPPIPAVPLPPGPHLEADELQQKSARELRVTAKEYEMENVQTMKKHELICEIIKRNMAKNGSLNSGGILELDRDGFGFLRSPRFNYMECPEDVYVSPSQVRRYNLRRGDLIYGPVRHLKDKERYFAMGRVDKIEGLAAEEGRIRPNFDMLTPMFPNRRIFLEGARGDVSMRAMDLICPLGFGQRGLIVAPPRTGKTILLQKIANAVMENNPGAHLIMLLIDERPEEVTDMQRTVKGEVLASTFDETPARHVHVAEMVMERAKRLVEKKVDVVILLDSITRLARAYNTLQPNSGKIMSGGIESSALQKPKRFFGAARNVEEGGSLTIIATALIDTGSRADNVIFEEFKGTGNMEVHLDRALSDQRVFPAINIAKSGTRKEENLYHPEELPRIHALRKIMSDEAPVDAMSMLLERIHKTSNNIEFLMKLKFL